MNAYFQPKPRRKFLLPAIATMALMVAAAVLLPALARPKYDHRGYGCVNNEKQMGIAFRGFAIDMGTSPMKFTNDIAPANPTPAP